MSKELDWENLLDDNCPKCGGKLFLNNCPKCHFKISKSKKEEIINNISHRLNVESYDDKYFFGE